MLDRDVLGRRGLLTIGLLMAAIIGVVGFVRCQQGTTNASVSDAASERVGSSLPHSRTSDTTRVPVPVGGLRLEGQVVDEQDRPVPGASVVLYGYDAEVASNDDGSFAFERLGAADYSVSATKGEDTYSETVSVSLSPTSEPVIIRILPGRRSKVVIAVPTERIEVTARITGAHCQAVTVETDDGYALLVNERCEGSLVKLGKLAPGPYRACVDEKKCTQFAIRPTPGQQIIELRAN